MKRLLVALTLAAVLTGGFYVDATEQAPSVCPADSRHRDATVDYFVKEEPAWDLHATYEGDDLAVFWGNMPPPPSGLVIETTEAVVFAEDEMAIVVFFNAARCEVGHYGPVPRGALFAAIGLKDA